MNTAAALDGKFPHTFHNSDFLGGLGLCRNHLPMRKESWNLKAIEHSVAVPVYFRQERFITLLKKTVQEIPGVGHRCEYFPMLTFQMNGKAHQTKLTRSIIEKQASSTNPF